VAYERGFNRCIGPSPGSQEGACESLKDPIALDIDVLFLFLFFGEYFQLFLVYLEKYYVKFT
jgi:hypothetical protein